MAVQDRIERNAAKHLLADEKVVTSFVGSTLSFGLSFAPLWASMFLTIFGLPDAVTLPLAAIGVVSAAYFFWKNENFAIIATSHRTLVTSSGRSAADRVDELVGEVPSGATIEPRSWFHSVLEYESKTIRFGRKQNDKIAITNARLKTTV